MLEALQFLGWFGNVDAAAAAFNPQESSDH